MQFMYKAHQCVNLLCFLVCFTPVRTMYFVVFVEQNGNSCLLYKGKSIFYIVLNFEQNSTISNVHILIRWTSDQPLHIFMKTSKEVARTEWIDNKIMQAYCAVLVAIRLSGLCIL